MSTSSIGQLSKPVATEFIDPVCGMTVKADSPHHADHEGHDYRFCSAGCRTKFVTDPARYLVPASIEAKESPPGTTYTCPMHPEIVRSELKEGDVVLAGTLTASTMTQSGPGMGGMMFMGGPPSGGRR